MGTAGSSVDSELQCSSGNTELVSLETVQAAATVKTTAGGDVANAKSDIEVLEELEPGVSRPLPPKLLPYFEGDFWPWEGEQALKNLIKEDIKKAEDEKEKRLFASSDGARRPRKTRRKASMVSAVSSTIQMSKPLKKIGDSTIVNDLNDKVE